jgi:hypothetical protein
MSAPIPMSAPDIPVSRTGLLAAASAVIAAGSVAVTIAVTTSGATNDGPAQRFAQPATAQPDAAKLYHHSSPRQQGESIGVERGQRAAERFHHFR